MIQDSNPRRAIDLRRLTPTTAARLLNSTPLGEVVSERRIHRHKNRAGYRIGEGRYVDLIRYIAWLVDERHSPKLAKPSRDYEAVKEAARARNAAVSEAGRDIGELPAVADPVRKELASRDFRFFCEVYFPETFHLAWSNDHLKVIAKIERAVLEGGLFAMAMPRATGKTVICERACLWAILYGHRNFVCLIGSDESSAVDMLDAIKGEIEDNELLLADFPEAVTPIVKLDGISNRAKGQLYHGGRTHIGWKEKEIIFPTIPGSLASGAIIRVAGITGRIRGMKYKRPDGRTVRPSLVVIDDPQTDESARSPSQCVKLESILAGAILGLAGPGCKISGIMPCTVIAKYDMADNILDQDKHPEWQGERTKMVYAFPTNEKRWAEYEQIYRSCLRAGEGIAKATGYYLDHQVEMDAGSSVAWPARHDPDEASAIQHAMNLRFRNEHAFFAEYQNEPLEAAADEGMLTAEAVAGKVNGMQREEIPLNATRLTMYIDVQQKLLFFVICAWEDDFTGYVIDYGAYPDQGKPYFTLREAKRTLATVARNAGLEGQIYAALEAVTQKHLSREYQRDDGAMLRIERCLVDANWGSSTDVVYQFCRQSQHATILLPCHGRYVGAASIPFSEYRKRPGDRVGLNWRIPNVQGKRAVRHAIYDTNWWKSFIHARLAVAMGDPGCLSLFGGRLAGGRRLEAVGERAAGSRLQGAKAAGAKHTLPFHQSPVSGLQSHLLFAQHITAEYRIQTQGRGRTVDEWQIRPEKPDNHWLDCLVGNAVAASIHGAVLPGTDAKDVRRERPRLKLSAIQGKRR